MLNSAKLFCPTVTEDYVPRVRLQERLRLAGQRPLTLVSAPAGYGKTTAVSAWLATSGLIRAWLSLDESDNDLTTFLAYFVAAIRRAQADFGLALSEMIDRAVPLTPGTFVEHLYAELDATDQDVALVLDDLNVIRNADVLAVIREVMRHPHPRLHLILLSRHDPPLPLTEWRARNQMGDIRSADLRFTLEETIAFLSGALDRPLDRAAMANVHANTEGWAAALRLAVLSFSSEWAEATNAVLEIGGGNQHIFEFLTDQVVASLPASRQKLLVQTSILDRLCGSLCEAVMGAPGTGLDGQAELRALYHENLFTVALDSDQRWFRYHHLFGEFLRGRLARECSEEEISQLHLRASRWFGEAGYLEEAMRHALAAGATREAILLFAANRQELFNGEHFGRLLTLHRLFPDDVIRSSPNLLLMEGWFAFTLRFDFAALGRVSSEVDALLDRLDIEPDSARRLRAENDAMKAMRAYNDLDAGAAIAYSESALQVLPLSFYTVRALARIFGAGAMQMQGKLSKALEYMRAGYAEDLATPDTPRRRNVGSSAYLHWGAGDLAGQEKVGEHVLSLVSPQTQGISYVWANYFLALAHYHWNNLAKAQYYAEIAFDGRLTHSGYFAVYAGLVLAQCHQAAGNPAKADEAMAETRAAAMRLQSQPLLGIAQAFEVELDVARGRLSYATQWAEQMLPVMQLVPLPMFYAPPLTVAKALLAANDPARAVLLGDYLGKWRVHLEAIHNVRFLIEVLAMEAMHFAALGDEPAAFRALGRSLALAEPGGFIRVYVDLGPQLKELLVRFCQSRTKTSYIARVLAAFAGGGPAVSQAGLVEPLTERELQILTLLADRYSNKEIAQELYIAPGTVKRHTINIYQKLNVESRRGAVEAARGLGIIR